MGPSLSNISLPDDVDDTNGRFVVDVASFIPRSFSPDSPH
jgi:hypothetical protein